MLDQNAHRSKYWRIKKMYQYSPSSILLNMCLTFWTGFGYMFDRLCTGFILFCMACCLLFVVLLACQPFVPSHSVLRTSQVAARVALHDWLVAASLMKLAGATVRGALSEAKESQNCGCREDKRLEKNIPI